jgi:hypothetical protein
MAGCDGGRHEDAGKERVANLAGLEVDAGADDGPRREGGGAAV